jgi:FtsX-like permease family
MTGLRLAWIPLVLAVRRIVARPATAMAIAAAVGGAIALIGWSSLSAAISSDDNTRVRLTAAQPEERAVQAVYDLVPGETDPFTSQAARFFAMFSSSTLPPRKVVIWHSVGPNVGLVVADDVERDVVATKGRLPGRCEAEECETLALAGHFRVGQRISFGRGRTLHVVGSGFVRRAALPLDSDSLPRTPDIGSRTILVRQLGPIRVLAKETGASVVLTAPLETRAVHASDLRALSRRLADEAVRLRRSTVRINVTAPFELLDEIADRGDVARIRLLLVAGQGAVLVLAFAAYCAAARRRDYALAEEQLETLGASRVQLRLARVVEAALPCATGTLLALILLYLGVYTVAASRHLPASFVREAVPPWTILTMAATAIVATALLVAAGASPKRQRRLGALELAALTAFGVLIWQTATTGALDADKIQAGQGVGPVLLLVPALAFFSAAILLLRLLPTVLRRAERLARESSFSVRLGLLSAARRPAEAAATTTFLAIALGTALFALNYRATLERQARDEARFTVGAQWRVSERAAPTVPGPARGQTRVGTDVQPPTGADVKPITGQTDVTPLSRYRSITSERPTPALRLQASVVEATLAGDELPVEVLGLPAASAHKLVGWKRSFSDIGPGNVGEVLAPHRRGFGGLRLARDARELRAWMRSDAQLTRFVVLHFFVPDRQAFVHLRGGTLARRWQRMRVRLPGVVRGAELIAVEFPPLSVPLGAPPDRGSVEVGGFGQQRSGGWSGLGSIEDWTASSAGGTAEVAEYAGDPVRRRLQLSLEGTALALIRPRIPDALIGVASPAVAKTAVDGIVTLHGVVKDIPVRVVATSRLFPTVVQDPRSFVIVDYASLFVFLNADYPGLVLPTEAWFFEPQRPDFLEALAQRPFRVESVVGVRPLEARLVNDPLGAGARDVLLVASAVAALLAFVGLALASRWTLAAERLLLAEYEALGVPPRTIARSLQLRMLVLSGVGVAAAILGAFVAVGLIGAAVAVTGEAGVPLPPIEPIIAWRLGILLAGAVALAALLAAWLLASRAMRKPAAMRLRA